MTRVQAVIATVQQLLTSGEAAADGIEALVEATLEPAPMGCDITHYLRKIPARSRLILDYGLDVADIVITTEVQQETVEAGLAGGYPDAVAIKERIDAGRIGVRTVARTSAPFEEVLDLYGLQEGDKAVVRLALQATDMAATVTDLRKWGCRRRSLRGARLPLMLHTPAGHGAGTWSLQTVYSGLATASYNPLMGSRKPGSTSPPSKVSVRSSMLTCVGD